MSTERFGVEVFPSLVESALAVREPKWRELEAALERLAEASTTRRGIPHPGAQGRVAHNRLDPEKEARALELIAEGHSLASIRRELGIGGNSVMRLARKAKEAA